jgi:hypothetical protein
MTKIKAVCYLDCLPPHNNNVEKSGILNNFLTGISAAGDNVIGHKGHNLIDSDIAIIVGYVHRDGKQLPHLQLRQKILDYQKSKGKKTLIADSNLFLYTNKQNPLHYLRYSFDGVFPTTGFYFDTNIDSNRFKQISQDLNISVKPYRKNGDHILFCLQRNGGWSMAGYAVNNWLHDTITKIRQFTNRHIVVRAHPGDKKIKQILKINYPNVSLSTKESLIEDLKNCWATVVYNSSPAVASIIEGVPSFITDPEPQHSQSYAVANTDLSLIEQPRLTERQNWLDKLCMSHWKFEEIKNGNAWNFFKKHI